MVSQVVDDNWKPSIIAASNVKNGKFKVYGGPGLFNWVVYGKRLEVVVEPLKSETDIEGKGPYKWVN